MAYTIFSIFVFLVCYITIGVGNVYFAMWISAKGYISDWLLELNDDNPNIICDMTALTVTLFAWPLAMAILLINLFFYCADNFWLRK